VRLVSGRTGAMIWRADGRAEFDQLGMRRMHRGPRMMA
jgi:hypothetical protein